MWNGRETTLLFLAEIVDTSVWFKAFPQGMLWSAVADGNETAIRLLLKYGADIDHTDILEGKSVLHHAVDDGDVAMVRLLIELGADVNSKDRLKTTPLHTAAWKGNEEMAKLLVRNGAKIGWPWVGSGREGPFVGPILGMRRVHFLRRKR